MTKIELVSAVLTDVCRFAKQCYWHGNLCPIGVENCGNVSITDWLEYLSDEKDEATCKSYLTEILCQLDRIEARLNANEDPKSLSAFVSQKIKEAAHR